MANLLDTDFGSESEDDNFNPAPAVGSDDEGQGDSDNEEAVKEKTNGTSAARQPSNQAHHAEGTNGTANPTDKGPNRGVKFRDIAANDEDEEEDAVADELDDDLGGGIDDDEEDEEDEEEEDVTVRARDFA